MEASPWLPASLTFGKYVNGRAVGQQPRPALELPGRPLHEHSHHTIPAGGKRWPLLAPMQWNSPLFRLVPAGKKRSPVLRCQFQWLVDDTVGHGDAQRGPARLDLVFAPMKQDLVVPRDALLLLVLRGDKPGQESSQDQPDAASPGWWNHQGPCSHFRSCRRSLALSMVTSEVVAAGMMMMGVRDPLAQK